MKKITSEELDSFLKPKDSSCPPFSMLILYLTNRCNLDCDYCYEKEEREKVKPHDMSEERLTKYLEDAHKVLSPGQKCNVVLFGGEPLLRRDLINHALNEIDRLGRNSFSVCLTTNGTFLGCDGGIDWVENIFKPEINSLEISWDGSGHDRRKLINSSSKTIVEHTLNKLSERKIPFVLRYTIHKDNYLNVAKDLIYAYEKWPSLKKIQVSYYNQELASICNVPKYIQNNKELYKAIYLKYKKPICLEICQLCRQCDRWKSEKTNVMYHTPDNKTHISDGTLNSKFNHWTGE